MGNNLQATVMTKALPVVSAAYTISEYIVAWLCLLHGARRELFPVVYLSQVPEIRFVLIQLLSIYPMFLRQRADLSLKRYFSFLSPLSSPAQPILAEKEPSK